MASLEQTHEAWDRFAGAYDQTFTPIAMVVAGEALRIAGVVAGDRLLDIAAGGGALSIPAARLGADVLATDFSPAMVELIKLKAQQQGLPNLQARIMDGTALDLDDDAFDVTCSQLGVLLFPDRRKGLSEMARVTRPGGKGVMVVFGPPQRVQFVSLFFQALRAAIPNFSLPQNSPLFSLQNPGDLRREMEEAGFRDIQVETVDNSLEVQSADHLWTTMQSSAPAIAGLLSQFSEEQQTAARRALGDLLRTQFGGGPAKLIAETHVGVGMK